MPVFRISLLLNKVSGMQVTSPDLKGRESEIPFSQEKEFDLDEASTALLVNKSYNT